MHDFRQRQRTRRLLSSNITIIALCIVIALLGREVWGIYMKEQRARESLLRAQTQYDSLQERSEFLESELALLNNDAGVESKLRERYGIAKPGEKVIMLIDEEGTTTPPEPDSGWWKKLWSWLF
jgi:cell division protein FtsB